MNLTFRERSARADDWFAPFVPDARHPFDRRAVAHLLRRAAFGGTIAEVDALAALGPAGAAAALVRAPVSSVEAGLDDTIVAVLGAEKIELLQSWFLLRTVQSKSPFRDKLALFLHGHFATSHRKVQSVKAMHAQMRLFLDLGAGDFRKLTIAVIRGAAMLLFLDGARSEKGRPNENLARELMELFTLGRNNYSEQDIREAARALTGWRVDGSAARFHKPSFDAGEKTVFQQRGNFNDEDIVQLCAAQPACARLLAKKLLAYYLMPAAPEPLVDAFANIIKNNQFSIGDSLEVLFTSRAFYSPDARRTIIKSPVDLAAGALRALNTTFPGNALAGAVSEMGQNLLNPPSVKGWDGDRAWIHAATWIARCNFSWEAAGAGADAFQAGAGGGSSGGELLDRALELLLQNDVEPGVRDALAGATRGRGAREILHAVLCLPEYQIH